ncbi:hypothetical protein, unknown function, partial [Leishmania infantum JPCM5]
SALVLGNDAGRCGGAAPPPPLNWRACFRGRFPSFPRALYVTHSMKKDAGGVAESLRLRWAWAAMRLRSWPRWWGRTGLRCVCVCVSLVVVDTCFLSFLIILFSSDVFIFSALFWGTC